MLESSEEYNCLDMFCNSNLPIKCLMIKKRWEIKNLNIADFKRGLMKYCIEQEQENICFVRKVSRKDKIKKSIPENSCVI